QRVRLLQCEAGQSQKRRIERRPSPSRDGSRCTSRTTSGTPPRRGRVRVQQQGSHDPANPVVLAPSPRSRGAIWECLGTPWRRSCAPASILTGYLAAKGIRVKTRFKPIRVQRVTRAGRPQCPPKLERPRCELVQLWTCGWLWKCGQLGVSR